MDTQLASYGCLKDMVVHSGAMYDIDMFILKEVQETYNMPGIDLLGASTVVDIGANIGAFSRYVAAVNPLAHIVAIEAVEENYNIARHNVAGFANIVLLHGMCCGITPGLLSIVLTDTNSGGHRIVSRADGDRYTGPFIVRPYHPNIIKLHDCVAILGKPIDVLKLDCEGSEYDILLNSDLTKVHSIVGEYHDGIGRFNNQLSDYLQSVGYRVTVYPPTDPNFIAAGIGIFTAIRH